jgi:hypothetical protein
MIQTANYIKIILLFSLLIPSFAFATTTGLPVISVLGQTSKNDQKVYLVVRAEASKFAPAYCFSEVAMPDGTTRYPHAFYVRGVTVSDFAMNYALDLEVQEGLKEKVLDRYPRGINFQGTQIPAVDYFTACRFRLKEVTLYTQETSLVIRDSFYNRLESTFRVSHGTTQTADFSLNRAGNHLKFKIFINKSE